MHGSAAVLGIAVGKAGKRSGPEGSPACLPRAEGISGESVLGPGSGDPLNILEASPGAVGRSLGGLSGVAVCTLLCFTGEGAGTRRTL